MRFYELPEQLKDDIDNYEKLVVQYKSGKVDKTRLKVFRVPMGIYEQREPDTYMCRIRLPGGAITPEQLVGVSEICIKYSDKPLHFTTRQEVQIHHVSLENTINIIKELRQIGLATRGGGGNTVRNIMGDVYSGIADKGGFDINPYVQALTSRMISEKDSWTLPRKYKIAFSSSESDRGLATVNDLGFIAKTDKAGKKGFSVYVAGGMGAKPEVGKLLFDFIPENYVYAAARALKTMFDKYGNRKNKYAARIRFLYNQLGKDEFTKIFKEEFKPEAWKPLLLLKSGSIKQGLVEIPLFLGDVAPQQAKLLGEILTDYGEDIIRVTTTQNLLIRNIDPNKIEELQNKLKQKSILEDFPPLIAAAVACAGASTCRLGICLSRHLLGAIKDEFSLQSLVKDNIGDLRLKISGCPNSCGQHHIADLGFFGVAKRHENQLAPSYTVLAGAIVEEGKTKLAEKIGILPARNIPKFLVELLKIIEETRNKEEKVYAYLQRTGKEKIEKLVKKYADIKDSSVYYDWGSDEKFSLAEKLEGECSAGLFDLIDWEFNKADKVLSKLDKSQADLKEVVLAVSRSLLITKGLEPETDKQAVELFKEHFVNKHIDNVHKETLEKYITNRDFNLDEVNGLVIAVKKLYESMDNSLKFPELESGREDVGLIKKERQLRDYRGVACPMNFVKTKLVLEAMQNGECLEILLDDGAPIENVPASVKQEGHKIIEQKQIDNYWQVLIEKNE